MVSIGGSRHREKTATWWIKLAFSVDSRRSLRTTDDAGQCCRHSRRMSSHPYTDKDSISILRFKLLETIYEAIEQRKCYL